MTEAEEEKGSANSDGSGEEAGPSKMEVWKEKEKAMREAQKEDGGGKKACVGIAAIIALLYSVAAAILFKMEWDSATLRKEEWTYACSYGSEGDGDAWRISE